MPGIAIYQFINQNQSSQVHNALANGVRSFFVNQHPVDTVAMIPSCHLSTCFYLHPNDLTAP